MSSSRVPFQVSQGLYSTSQVSAVAEATPQHTEASGGILDDQRKIFTPRDLSTPNQSMPPSFRRSSLQIPGAGTRVPSRDNMGRNSLPTKNIYSLEASDRSWDSLPRKHVSPQEELQEELQDCLHDPPKPTLLPFQGMALGQDEEHTRAETPSDLGYSHIGAFKLGSLRITNGTASPTPSGPDVKHFEPHFEPRTAENLGTETSSIPASQETLVCQGPSFSSKISGGQDVRHDPYLLNRSDNPTTNVHDVQVCENRPEIMSATVKIRNKYLEVSNLKQKQPHIPDLDTKSSRVSKVIQDYTQDVAISPFSFEESPSISPTLRPTTATEDIIFDDHASSNLSRMSSSGRELERVKVRTRVRRSLSSTSLQLDCQITARDTRMKAQKDSLVKADSGYYSLRSRNSVNEAPTASRAPSGKSASQIPRKPVNSRNTGSALGTVKRIPTSGSGRDSPTLPSKDLNLLQSSPTRISGSRHRRERFSLPIDSNLIRPVDAPGAPTHAPTVDKTWIKPAAPKEYVKTPVAVLSPLDGNRMPIKTPTSRHSMPALPSTLRASRSPSDPETLAPSVNRKIQRLKVPLQSEIIVQCCTEIEPTDIPPISQKEEASLEERIKNLPPLTHTYKSVHRTSSKDTLAADFSMTPTKQTIGRNMTLLSRFNQSILNVPSNAAVERLTRPHANDTSVVSDAYRGDNERSRSLRGPQKLNKSSDRSRRRRGSGPNPQEDPGLRITSFGTVSESLGPSPYDGAYSSTPQQGSSLQGPIAIQAPRGRNLEAGSSPASRFVPERSRMSEDERRLRRCQSYEGQRQRAFDQGTTPARVLRPTSWIENTPPVPALPAGSVQSYDVMGKSKSRPPVSLAMGQKRLSTPLLHLPPSLAPGPLTYTGLEQPPKEIISRAKSQKKPLENQRTARGETRETKGSARHSTQPGKTLPSPRSYESLGRTGDGRPPEKQRQRLPPPSTPAPPEQDPYPQWSAMGSYSAHPATRSPSPPWAPPQAIARSQSHVDLSANEGRRKQEAEAEPLVLDRYSGGVGIGYGSAGLGSGTAAETGRSRAEGDLFWGVDLRDVPVMDVPARRSVAIG